MDISLKGTLFLSYIFEQNSLKENYLHSCLNPTKPVILCEKNHEFKNCCF